MAVSFEVYPGSPHRPCLGELLELGARRVRERLAFLGLPAIRTLTATVREGGEPLLAQVAPTHASVMNVGQQLLVCDERDGSAFSLSMERVDDTEREYWRGLCAEHPPAMALTSCIEDSLSLGYYWRLSRYFGASALIQLAHGLYAGALAELTEGFVFSDDKAWDYSRLPCRASALYGVYLYPEQHSQSDWAADAETFLQRLRREEAS